MISATDTFEMPFGYTLQSATFISRPNRFLAELRHNDEVIQAHVPDPGRLKELLIPGAHVMIRHNPGPTRKTDWTLTLVKNNAVWVCVNTTIPNTFVGKLLSQAKLVEFMRYGEVRAEVPHRQSRFDFHLSGTEEDYWLEVKSVSLVHNRVGLFPDAPTSRGTRHLDHLVELIRDGNQAGVLFLVQRNDADLFAPNWITDPTFASTLKDAHKHGLEIVVYTTRISPEKIVLDRRIPWDLSKTYPLPELLK